MKREIILYKNSNIMIYGVKKINIEGYGKKTQSLILD